MKYLLVVLSIFFLLAGAGTRTIKADGGTGEGVTVVHEETIQVGAYQVTIGFSEWPLAAERSFDMIFTPVGSIEGKKGTVTLIGPDGEEDRHRLARHPRMREVWGIDLIALSSSGSWTLQFEIDGAQGKAVGRLSSVPLGERPGPPAIYGWLLALVPLLSIFMLLIMNWRRTHPGKQAQTWAWKLE